jgi:hypothetical protein
VQVFQHRERIHEAIVPVCKHDQCVGSWKHTLSEAKFIKSNDVIPFRSTTCACTTLPTLWSHSTLATRSFQKSAKHRAPFAPTMRSRHRTLSSGAFEDGLKSRAAVRWALSALHGAPVCASSTNILEFRGAGTPSTSDGTDGIDHIPLSSRASV